LTLEKTVVNDNGGTATDTAWTLQATDGTTTISGTEGVAAITSATVTPGTYTLSETGPAGYTQTSLTCTGAADTDPSDGLTLAAGETVTCTFTNDDLVADTIAVPNQCGDWNHKGWLTHGTMSDERDLIFGSGDLILDPYAYTPMERDAAGRIVTYHGVPSNSQCSVLKVFQVVAKQLIFILLVQRMNILHIG